MSDPYKANIIKNESDRMRHDEYYIVQLRGDNGKPINLDQNALRLLQAYYDGSITEDQVRSLSVG